MIKGYAEISIQQKKKTDTNQQVPNIKMVLKLTKEKSEVFGLLQFYDYQVCGCSV